MPSAGGVESNALNGVDRQVSCHSPALLVMLISRFKIGLSVRSNVTRRKDRASAKKSVCNPEA